ncbi:MAG: arylsulfatase [Pirellulaceae bacterium]
MTLLLGSNMRLVLVGLICWIVFAQSSLAEQPATLPNIVILYADDMGYGDLAIQNPQSKIKTPHLDELARSGIRFTDAHSSSGICTPSRYALLTGRYHWRKFHDIVNSFGPSVISPERTTLPELLKTRGYRTACIGKWHLGWNWKAIMRDGAEPSDQPGGGKGFNADDFDWAAAVPGGPCDHGFDYYFGDDVPNFPPYCWIENDHVVEPPTVPLQESPKTAEGSWECRKGPMVDGWQLDAVMPRLTEQAVDWIQKQPAGAEPFFLYMPFTSPHAPIVPSNDFAGTSAAGGYGDYMQQTDDTVGRVIQALKDSGHYENTLIIFTADNGPEIYALERLRKFDHSSMANLRGIKRSIWEGGHRVPMIVSWPGKVPENQTCDRLVSQIDLFHTLASIVDTKINEGDAEDSLDQSTLLLDPQSPTIRTELVHNTYKDRYALRSGEWLYLDVANGNERQLPEWYEQLRGYPANDKSFALFNMQNDREQLHDVAESNPEIVRQLSKRLKLLRR